MNELFRPTIKLKGRLQRPAKPTGAGEHLMATSMIHVEIHGRDLTPAVWHVGVVAFGDAGIRLSECKKYDVISVAGELTRRPWTKGGIEHAGFSINVTQLEVLDE